MNQNGFYDTVHKETSDVYKNVVYINHLEPSAGYMHIVNLEAFASTEFNEIFSGRQQLSALRDTVFSPHSVFMCLIQFSQ